jgi:O-antigen ligase
MGSSHIVNARSPRRRAPVVSVARKPVAGLDALRLSLAALMVIQISRVHGQFPLLASARPLLVLTGIALAAALLNPGALAASGWMKRWQAKVLYGMTIAALGSIAFGISQGGAFFFFYDSYSKTLIGGLLLMAAIRNARDLRLFVWAYVIGTAILVWMALFVFQMTESNGVTRLAGLDTWDSNDLGVLLLTGLAMCGLAFRTSRLTGKVIAAAVLLGVGAGIARSGSRGGFVGFVCVLLAYLFSVKGTKIINRVAVLGVIVTGLAIAAPAGYWEQMQTIVRPEADYNWDAPQGRRQLAIRGMHYMMDRPVFGIGLNNFGRAEATISDFAIQRDPNGPGIKWSVAHNSYVQAGAELGVPGLLLFCALVLGCIVSPWKLRRRIPDAWQRGSPEEQFLFQSAVYLPLATLGFAVPAYFVSFAYNDPIYILAALTSALPACVNAQLRATGQPPGRPGAADRPPTTLPARAARWHTGSRRT